MAGGFGTRIRPLTTSLPKPMLSMVNTPLMEHIVRLLRSHGYTELVVLLYYQPEVIRGYFGDGSEWRVKVYYVTPTQDLGTAGAVKAAERYLDSTFLVISGDLLTDMDLTALKEFHQDSKALVTLGLISVANPLQFGVVITERSGKIVKFLEKPGWGEVFSDTINTGVYMMEPEVLDHIPSDREFDFSKELFPALLSGGKPLFGYHSKEYWRDIGDPDSYRGGHYDVFNGLVNIQIPGEKLDLVGRDVRVGSEVHLSKRVRFEGTVLLGNNVMVGERCRLRNCVVGNNCSIGPRSRVLDSVIWDSTYLEEGTEIKGAIICSGVRIGEGSVIEKGAVVAEGCSIGAGAVMKEGVMIWPHKVLEEGAVLADNLIWGEKWKKRLFESGKVIGFTNMELTPEFVAKLGVAYGSTLPKGACILTGRDSYRASRMLKRSFIGGVLSAGVNVKDLRLIAPPVLRYKLQSFGEVGAVIFRQSRENPFITEICFYDTEGLGISTSQEKGIERIFAKEDFRRVHYTEPGGISEMPKVVEFYKEGFLKSLDKEAIRSKGFKIVVDFSHGPSGSPLSEILGELGCSVVGINAYMEEAPPETGGTISALESLSKIVRALGAHAGFRISPSGEEIILVDEEGNVYAGVEALMVVASLVLEVEKPGTLLGPAAVPSTLEDAASSKGFSLRRIPQTHRSLTEACRKGDVVLGASLEGGFIFPRFHYVFDGMFTLAKVLEMLAQSGLSLKGAMEKIPESFYVSKQVSCPWELKGALMRRMSEEAADKEASFIDGIKIFFQNGSWVLVLPDEGKPVLHIIAEAKEHGEAQALVLHYQDTVTKWKDELKGS